MRGDPMLLEPPPRQERERVRHRPLAEEPREGKRPNQQGRAEDDRAVAGLGRGVPSWSHRSNAIKNSGVT